MSDSMVVDRWIERAQAKTKLEERQRFLLDLLEWRFPGIVSKQISRLVIEQTDPSLLRDWSKVVARAPTMEDILESLQE